MVRAWVGRLQAAMAMLCLAAAAPTAWAQETVCARVKIEIKQELTLERQAFDAEMKINNTTDTGVIENVSVVVKVTDEAGTPIAVTDDPNDLSAKFFLRLSSKQNISAVDGTGTVNPKTTSIINWLLIPAPGSAGSSPLGKKYLVGATLKYRFGGEDTVLDVSPDVITVKPLPLLSLDYFLTQDVWADDPLTPAVEPPEPFTLGVRVKNNGMATAKSLKIDSAQPKIIENNQGLLINFVLTGSYLNDAPAQKTLLIDFGDIAPNTSKMGRWVMETTLAGKFTEFTAKFSHSDELGGALTSILQATNAHFLIRDVRVDLPGRDFVRDFLARDGDVIRVYESDGPDTIVTDRSGVATLAPVAGGSGGNASYRLTFPRTDGFVYVRLPDPYSGTKAVGKIVRSDAKELSADNVWLSRTRNEQTKQWEYWVNFFDVNSTGVYDSEFQAPPAEARAPVLQFVPDRVTQETKQVSFVVEASSPDGKPVVLDAAPLPAGATFTRQAADPSAPGLSRAVFDWTPAKGAAGTYLVTYTASDGSLSASRSASIKVESIAPPPGPATPAIESPLPGAQVQQLKPELSVKMPAGTQDPSTKVHFEVYADEAETQLVASALVDKAVAGGSDAVATVWQVPSELLDNTHYWWRARGFDGNLYSAWANGRFFVNTFNDPPDSFNLTSPAPDAEVSSLTPTLVWTNSRDKDGDTITYSATVFTDEALSEVYAQAVDLPEHPSGSTSWQVSKALANHVKYHWRVVAKDTLGAQTATPARAFMVNAGNAAPTAPLLTSPAPGGVSTSGTTTLVIQNSTDADGDQLTYVFEIDSVNTFDSADRQASGPVAQGGSGTSWTVADLRENQRYWWRVKAQDGRAESAWSVGDFLVNAVNDPPPTPTVKNPGNGAWTATQQPSLEANPVLDPEGEAVHYEFEVFRDAALKQRVAQGQSDSTAWIVGSVLADKTTHWWHVRALDVHGAASGWSLPAVLYVSTAPYQNPTIAVTEPATPVVPSLVTVGGSQRKQVVIRWDGTDPNIEPTVALYYGTSKSGYTGSQIVDGLRQMAGAQSGSYVWDVTNLAPGTYYVYAAIYDSKGVGRAYAPGAVVIAPPRQAGSITVSAPALIATTEAGGSASFTVRLGRAPVSNVVVPVSSTKPGKVSIAPESLTFTPSNWSKAQTVTVTGKPDCVPDLLQAYQVLTGPAQSLDGDYIGLSGKAVNGVSVGGSGLPGSTNNPNVHICRVTLVSERKVDARTWEYVLRAELTNTGAPLRGVVATLQPPPLNVERVDSTLVFGAVGQDETVKTSDTVTLRARFAIPIDIFKIGIGLGYGAWFKWNVVVQP